MHLHKQNSAGFRKTNLGYTLPLYLQNKALVSKVVLVGMPGLDADLFTSKQVTQLGSFS